MHFFRSFFFGLPFPFLSQSTLRRNRIGFCCWPLLPLLSVWGPYIYLADTDHFGRQVRVSNQERDTQTQICDLFQNLFKKIVFAILADMSPFDRLLQQMFLQKDHVLPGETACTVQLYPQIWTYLLIIAALLTPFLSNIKEHDL